MTQNAVVPSNLAGFEALWRDHLLPYLRTLTGSDDPANTPVCWQLIDDRKLGQVRPRCWHQTLSAARADLIRAQAAGGSVHAALQLTDGLGRSRGHVLGARTVYLDLDAPGTEYLGGGVYRQPDGTIRAFPLEPSMVVKPSRGFHAYWCVRGGELGLEGPGSLEELVWNAAVAFGGDREATHGAAAHCLRAPGFFHLKREPVLVELLANEGHLYEAAQLRAAFPPFMQEPYRPKERLLWSGDVVATDQEQAAALDAVQVYLEARPGATSGEGRNNHTYATAQRVLDWSGSEQAYQFLSDWNRARNQPPYSPAELAEVWKNAARYRSSPPGASVALGRLVADAMGDLPSPPVVVSAEAPAPFAQQVFQPGVANVSWRTTLSGDRGGKTFGTPNNILVIMSNHEAWKGCVAFDELKQEVVWRRRPPFGDLERSKHEWQPNQVLTESDYDRIRVWFEREETIFAAKEAIWTGVQLAAERFSFHPVREYLEGLVWDGIPRVDTWLVEYMGTIDRHPDRPFLGEYVKLVGRYFLISAVARACSYRNGCKVDTMMVLEGAQGQKKSSSLRALAVKDEWFSDTTIDVDNLQRAYEALSGVWLQEVQEMNWTRTHAYRYKAFISKSDDQYREAYGRKKRRIIRQCVFIGTGNEMKYLKDLTGNRRFLPVTVTNPKPHLIIANRDMLWAEAYQLYLAGERYWVTSEEAHMFQAEQNARLDVDNWIFPIVEWLENNPRRNEVTGAELMGEALELDKRHWDRQSQARVNDIMDFLKWTCCLIGEKRLHGFRRPTQDFGEAQQTLPLATELTKGALQ